MQTETVQPSKTTQPSKKAYHEPNVRVYGDLKQLTLTTPNGTGQDLGYYASS